MRKEKRSILFVCTGNICRSPTAEGVFRDLSEKAGLELHIASAGLGDWHVGQPPDERSQHHARKRGYDLSAQRARQVRAALVRGDENAQRRRRHPEAAGARRVPSTRR